MKRLTSDQISEVAYLAIEYPDRGVSSPVKRNIELAAIAQAQLEQDQRDCEVRIKTVLQELFYTFRESGNDYTINKLAFGHFQAKYLGESEGEGKWRE